MGAIIISVNGVKTNDIRALISDVMSLSDEFSKDGVEISEKMAKSFRTDTLECIITSLVVTIIGSVASGMILKFIDRLRNQKQPGVNIQIQMENNYYMFPAEEEELKKYLSEKDR